MNGIHQVIEHLLYVQLGAIRLEFSLFDGANDLGLSLQQLIDRLLYALTRVVQMVLHQRNTFLNGLHLMVLVLPVNNTLRTDALAIAVEAIVHQLLIWMVIALSFGRSGWTCWS